MAHLVKLEDSISRYQFDLNRYLSQFTRMKKERWYYLKTDWEQAQSETNNEWNQVETVQGDQRRLHGLIQKMKSWSKISSKRHDEDVEQVDSNFHQKTLEEVKEEFLQELFHTQLRWANSALLEESTLHPKYKEDPWLHFFTQKLPDNYFVMYHPIFSVKQAPIELEVVLISPTEIYCISLLKGEKHSVFEASSDRFWTEFVNQSRTKRLSPLVSLSRMTGVMKSILEEANLSFPVRNIVLCKDGIIDNKIQGAKVELVDRRNFQTWYEKAKKHPSPIKSQQLKITSLLLDHCYTNSTEREADDEEQDVINEDLN
ncbi:hypothetical protein JCM9140_1803 [Halalkalibacter wakoensis JCM 9140]|uniref:NERD domain-containing protein n=1 Tax=Halalkalibacter wakoensis JCM 9140 TaxID=1236970 RepID=W4Q1D9_9BACI|nr:NERD domain-containing protein [Halalkalibacter wakoensis]GAE25787.1 hypothetical protein JCM9140_1803 [Halalkalibacter wakoensis JCM 9140]